MATDTEKKSPDVLLIVGLVLLLVPVLPGILLYAVVATVVGEGVLEGPDAVPFLAPVIVWLPNMVGAVLLIVRWRAPHLARFSSSALFKTLLVFGLVLVALATYGLATQPSSADPNIGAGFMLLAGIPMAVHGAFRTVNTMMSARRREAT